MPSSRTVPALSFQVTCTAAEVIRECTHVITYSKNRENPCSIAESNGNYKNNLYVLNRKCATRPVVHHLNARVFRPLRAQGRTQPDAKCADTLRGECSWHRHPDDKARKCKELEMKLENMKGNYCGRMMADLGVNFIIIALN